MARKLVVEIVGDSKGLSRAFNKADREAARFGGSIESVSGRVARASKVIGASLATSVAVGVGAAVKSTVDFDKAMRNVNSIAQLNEKQFGKLEKSVLGLAGKTAQAPKTLAEGLYDLVSSGFKSRDALKILHASAKAATAGLTDTATSTKAVAAVLNAYHEPASKANEVSDTLFQTVNRGVISFEELSTTIGDVLPFAASLGVGLDQVGASVSTMTKAGISAPETMTRIKSVMEAFIKPSADMAKAIKATGAESGEALVKQKGFQGGLEAVIGTTDKSKSAVAKLFPNIRALGGALALTGDNAKSAHDDIKGFSNVTGSTDKALKEQSKSISYQWQKIKAKLSADAIAAGSVVVPAMAGALDAISGFVSDVKDKVGSLTGLFSNLRLGGASVPEALGKTLSAAFQSATGSIDWSGVGAKMSAGLTGAFNLSGKLPGLISQGISAAVSKVNGRQVLGKLVDVIGEAVDALFSPSFWIKHFMAIFSIVTLVIPVGKILKIPGFSLLYRLLSGRLFKVVGAVGKGVASLFGKAGERALVGFLAGIEQFAPKVAHFFLGMVTDASGTLKGLASKLVSPFKSAFSRIGSVIGNGAERVGSAVGKVAGIAIKGLSFVGGYWLKIAKGWGGKLASGIRATIGLARSAVTGVVRGVQNVLRAVIKWFVDIGKDIVRGLVRGIKGMAKGAVDAVGDLASSLAKKAKGVLHINSPSKVFEEIGKGVVEGFANGLTASQAVATAALKSGLLFPVEAAIADIQDQRDKLQKSFDDADTARQGKSLRSDVRNARKSLTRAENAPIGVSGSGSGSSSDGFSASGTTVVQALSSLARHMGLKVTSTTGGKHVAGSNHYKGLAIDAAGAPKQMAAFFDYMKKNFGPKLLELFYDPKGGLKNGKSIGAIGGHSDHVHVAASSVSSLVGKVGKGAKAAARKATGKLSAEQMRGFLYAAGFRGHDLDVAVAIGMAESGGKVRAKHKNSDGSVDRGFMQINSVHGAKSTFDPAKGARGAKSIFDSAGKSFKDWVTYQTGAFKKFLGSTGKGKGAMPSASASAKRAAELARRIDANNDKLTDLRTQKRNLPTGKKGTAQRKALSNQIAALVEENRQLREEKSAAGSSASKIKSAAGNLAEAKKALSDFNREQVRAGKLAVLDLKESALTKLKTFKDSIDDLKGSMGDMAKEAAAAWRQNAEGAIDATLKTKLAAIAAGDMSRELLKLQADDSAESQAREDASNKKSLADAQRALDEFRDPKGDYAKAKARLARAKASGNKSFIDSAQKQVDDMGRQEEDLVQGVEDAKYGIRETARQRRIGQLQSGISDAQDAAQKEADDAKGGLDQQESDLATSLGTQLGMLVGNLEARKQSYRDFVTGVKTILGPYGQDFQGSADQEAAIANGPSVAGMRLLNAVSKNGKLYYKRPSDGKLIPIDAQGNLVKRAAGGPVRAGTIYRVGEVGPENIRMGPDGRFRVSPASQSKAGGGSVIGHMTVNNYGDKFAEDRFASKVAFKIASGRG